MSSAPTAVVVGGGPAGLATAACLKRGGVDALVLESGSRVGDHWRGHYDRLHLHTARALSSLPGMALPRAAGPWVSRDDLADYLEAYAGHHRLRVRTSATVASVRRTTAGTWDVVCADDVIATRFVVVATGHNRQPHLPDWPGMADFGGRILHSSAYRSPEPFRDRRVLVVGAGNSGAEIAVDLQRGGAREVLWSVRTAPNILPRDLFGVPMQFFAVASGLLPTRAADVLAGVLQRAFVADLGDHGLPRPRRGVASQFAAGGTAPMLDVGLVDAVRSHAVTPVPAVVRLREDAVTLSDGTEVAIDTVIAATGYRAGLEDLVGELGVLDREGRPRAHAAALADAPGLYFVGYRPTIGGHLRDIGHEARRVARAIGRSARASPRPPAARRDPPIPRRRRPGRPTRWRRAASVSRADFASLASIVRPGRRPPSSDSPGGR